MAGVQCCCAPHEGHNASVSSFNNNMVVAAPPTALEHNNMDLIASLKASIPYIEVDEFHPVLYEAMAGLHQYIGVQQSRLMSGANVVIPTNEETRTESTTISDNNETRSKGVETGDDSGCAEAATTDTVVSTTKTGPRNDGRGNRVPSPTMRLETEKRGGRISSRNVPVTKSDGIARTEVTKPNPPELKAKMGLTSKEMEDQQHRENTPSASRSIPSPDHDAANRTDSTGQTQQSSKSRSSADNLQPQPPVSEKAPSTPSPGTPPHHENIPASVRLEQEKKLAKDRRRQSVELQRKLARAEWKVKDLTSKLKFLATEQRKLNLAVQSQQPGSVAGANAAESLRHTVKQRTEVEGELRDQQREVVKIKAEIEQHKSQPMDSIRNEHAAQELAVEQTRRLHEQNQRVRDIEAQKKAAVEQRRQQLEEERRKARQEQKKVDEEKKRRFLETEQRKQDLVNSAKAGLKKSNVTQHPSLSEKLHAEWSELDAKVEKGQASRKESTRRDEEAYGGHATPMRATQADTTGPNNPPSHQSEPQQATSDPHPTTPFESSTPQQSSTDSDQKYMQMADENEGEQSDMTELKHRILLGWALQPPALQTLRPIVDLLLSIHDAFPPPHDILHHEYFGSWQKISKVEIVGHASFPDEKRLSKAVRKLRFFLHPDKLPRDFKPEHIFICKLLWDVTNDAWEDHKKAKEQLDWVNS